MTIWDTITAWFTKEEQAILPALTKVEHEVLSVFQPLLAAAEAEAISELTAFIKGVVTSNPNPGSMTLADWETAILNGLAKLGGDLLGTAQGLKSNVIQALIAMILAALP